MLVHLYRISPTYALALSAGRLSTCQKKESLFEDSNLRTRPIVRDLLATVLSMGRPWITCRYAEFVHGPLMDLGRWPIGRPGVSHEVMVLALGSLMGLPSIFSRVYSTGSWTTLGS